MIYFLTTTVFVIGVLFHVMVKINGLRTKFPTLTFKTVWTTFFSEEWNTLIASVLVLAVTELAIFIINYQGIVIPEWLNWGIYPIALLMGYQGQRIIYKYLNTASDALERKAEAVGNLTPNGKP
jgi:hypothetical protein